MRSIAEGRDRARHARRAQVSLEQVGTPLGAVPLHVLGEVGQLQADADVVRQRDRRLVGDPEHAEHQPPDRGGREHAVGVELLPVLVGAHRLILDVGRDQVEEGFPWESEGVDRGLECD